MTDPVSTLTTMPEVVGEHTKAVQLSFFRRLLWRSLRGTLFVLVVILVAGWWNVLRVVEENHWPVPVDAITSNQAQVSTEAFMRRDDPRRDDIALAYAPSTASDVQLFVEGLQFFPAMLDDLEAADHSIHITMFTFTPGEWGTRFAEVLTRKAGNGVEVRLTVDRYGAKVSSTSEQMFRDMADAGVEIVVNDVFPLQAEGLLPDRDLTLRQDEIGRVDHRKMIVVDGEIGWIGGAGFEDHFANGGYHDVFVRVEGDIVRQMQAVFLTSFRAYGGPVPDTPGALTPYFPEPLDAGSIRVTLLQNIPGGFLPGTQASRDVIERATGRLDIMNPYLADPGMIDLIVDAAERGVAVRLLTSVASNNEPADAALRHEYPRLLDAGVEIWEYPAVMHAKVTVTDDTAIIGSINYDAWALYRNLEIALLFEDPSIAARVRTTFVEPDIAESQSGVPDTGRMDKIENWFWDKLTYFL